MELARQRLNMLLNLPDSVGHARDSISSKLDDCYSSLCEIRRLDSNTPDVEGLVKSSINALPAGYKSYKKQDLSAEDKRAVDDLAATVIWEVGKALVNSYNLSTERDNYSKRYHAVRSTAYKTMASLADGSPYSAVARSAGRDDFIIGVDPSIAETYINDIVEVQNNTGKDLTDVSVFLALKGLDRPRTGTETDHHFHFISSWKAGTTKVFWYPTRSMSGIASNESVYLIRKLDAFIYANEIVSTTSLDYNEAKYTEAVKAWAQKNLKPESFHGRWWTNAETLLDPAGFNVSYDGDLSSFQMDGVIVEAKFGDRTVGIHNSDKSWSSGSIKWICHQNFNSINPSDISIEIAFPGTSYKHVLTWTR